MEGKTEAHTKKTNPEENEISDFTYPKCMGITHAQSLCLKCTQAVWIFGVKTERFSTAEIVSIQVRCFSQSFFWLLLKRTMPHMSEDRPVILWSSKT